MPRALVDGSHDLLNDHEHHNTGKHAQSNIQIGRVVVPLVAVAVTVIVAVAVRMIMTVRVAVVMGVFLAMSVLQCMWDEVKESITQKATRCKAQQNLQEALACRSVVKRDEDQQESGNNTDQECAEHGLHPHCREKLCMLREEEERIHTSGLEPSSTSSSKSK
jgi:hypothetical protein